jgi:predicted ABC-type ATPase
MPNLYIISGCNGAGKTTASYTILPEVLNCREFVNADNIAAGLSPFNPESVALESGRMMLKRIDELVREQADFAIETTLSTRSYVSLIKEVQSAGYKVSLLYFWLSSPEVAIERVAKRVTKGGHHIPSDVIERRYYRGIYNLYHLYMPVCDEWVLVNNMDLVPEIIAKSTGLVKTIFNNELWEYSKQHGHG